MRPEQESFFTRLYQDNFWKLNRYACIHLNPAQAEEVVQDTFHEAVEKIEGLARHENPAGWLMESLKNRIRNLKRKNQRDLIRLVSIDMESVREIPGPEQVEAAIEEAENLQEVSRKIEGALSENELYILRRFVFEKASHKELAKEFGISVWTSQKRLERIRNKLGAQFPEHREKK